MAVVTLTHRQHQTLRLASLGLTEKETAVELGIGQQTVKEHRKRVMERLNARSMQHAVAVAFREGLLR